MMDADMENIFIGLGLELNGAAMVVTIVLIITLSLVFIFSDNLAGLENNRGGKFLASGIRVFTIILSFIFVVTTINQVVSFILSS
jgi:hypothetical protein